MKSMHRIVVCLALLSALGARAASTDAQYAADLPPPEAAAAAIDSHPAVQAAAAGVDVEAANRDRLRAGPYEPTLRGEGARRSVSSSESEGPATYPEWAVSVERALRLPRKAELDASLGDASVNAATLALGDARHEAGRDLLRAWIGWLRERGQHALWRTQLDVLREQARVTDRRLKAGDASRLELEQISAAVAQVQAALAQAASRERTAEVDLRAQFPGLALPGGAVLVEPATVGESQESWRDRVMAENHELMYARAQVERQRIVASRVDAERTPDPSVGVRLSSERGGAERVAGLFVSIPLAGEARLASARAARSALDVAERREEAVRRKVAAEAASAFTRAVGSHRAWSAAKEAAQRLERSAALAARGYELGETPMTDVLVARRAAVEGELAAFSLLADAVEARYRLLLDAHMLWPLDPDEHPQPRGAPR